MTISDALDEFCAALKARKAAEIAYVGASEPTQRAAARENWSEAIGAAIDAGLRLLEMRARSPADLVMKAKALRMHAPDRIEIAAPITLGGDQPPRDAPFPVVALHFLVRDLLALAE